MAMPCPSLQRLLKGRLPHPASGPTWLPSSRPTRRARHVQTPSHAQGKGHGHGSEGGSQARCVGTNTPLCACAVCSGTLRPQGRGRRCFGDKPGKLHGGGARAGAWLPLAPLGAGHKCQANGGAAQRQSFPRDTGQKAKKFLRRFEAQRQQDPKDARAGFGRSGSASSTPPIRALRERLPAGVRKALEKEKQEEHRTPARRPDGAVYWQPRRADCDTRRLSGKKSASPKPLPRGARGPGRDRERGSRRGSRHSHTPGAGWGG